MANYDPERPRPSIDATAALPGDEPSDDSPGASDSTSVSDAESDVDPAPAPASHLLPRQAPPLDRRLLAAFGSAVIVGSALAAATAWWLWRRWRRRQ